MSTFVWWFDQLNISFWSVLLIISFRNCFSCRFYLYIHSCTTVCGFNDSYANPLQEQLFKEYDKTFLLHDFDKSRLIRLSTDQKQLKIYIRIFLHNSLKDILKATPMFPSYKMFSSPTRVVFSTQLNICDGTFFAKIVNKVKPLNVFAKISHRRC